MALVTFSNPEYRDKTVYAVAGSHTETLLKLARENKIVLPSFGYHPWYVAERTADWLRQRSLSAEYARSWNCIAPSRCCHCWCCYA